MKAAQSRKARPPIGYPPSSVHVAFSESATNQMSLEDLRQTQRVIILGGPRVGKSTLAGQLSGALGIHRVRETDHLIGSLPWSEASQRASEWLDESGPWIVEGTGAVRALRKWLARTPEGKPADLVFMLRTERIERSRGQHAMSKGVQTVWQGIAPELIRRRVRIATE